MSRPACTWPYRSITQRMITPASADAAATEKDEADALDAMRLPRLVQVSLVLEVVTSWLVYKSFFFLLLLLVVYIM